ncbi:MAG: DNA mismatch repair endonuclease MutL, partial [Desulfobulbaceae bacterium]|nr:DNA mismatch repair endonuclease MutL [Desulfobulbaceae bacterium]
DVVKNYSLAYPKVGFAYQVNGREVFSCPAVVDDLETRVRAVGGRRIANVPLVRLEEASDGVKVHGFLAPPDAMPGAGGRLRLFVNGRVVRDRMIVHALAEGLRGFLMKGARPVGALFIDVPPENVDVNVHPTKQEIRFHRPTLVHRLVSVAAREGITRYQQSLKSALFEVPRPKMTSSVTSSPVPPPPVETWAQPELPMTPLESSEPEPFLPSDPAPVACSPMPTAEREPVAASHPPKPANSTSVTVLHPIGQLLDTYILCEADDGLVAIDQHAAHERLLFEEMKRQYGAGAVARQTLLFPKVIECDVEELQLVERFGPEISALGVDIEPFGGDSYVVKAVPAIVSQLDPEVIVRDFLAQLAAGGGGTAIRVEAVLASMACKAAIKAGHALQPEEIQELLRKMREADIFSHCPHGRPVVKRFTGPEIKRWFHRG